MNQIRIRHGVTAKTPRQLVAGMEATLCGCFCGPPGRYTFKYWEITPDSGLLRLMFYGPVGAVNQRDRAVYASTLDRGEDGIYRVADIVRVHAKTINKDQEVP